MINAEVREHLANELDIDAALFENPSFDNSIIGVTTTGHVVYAFDSMVKELMKDDDMSESEAVDFIDYNTLRALPYVDEEIRPIVIYELVI